MAQPMWMVTLSILMLLECVHFGIRGVAMAQNMHSPGNKGNASSEGAKGSDIVNYDEIKPIVSAHRGRLIRVSGRLTSLVMTPNSVTYGITARDGSLVFVRGSLPPKYTHTGIAVTAIVRVPESISSVLILELVDFEQANPAQSPVVSRASQGQANLVSQASVERASATQLPQSSGYAPTPMPQQPLVQAHIPMSSGQANAVPIYSAWVMPPAQLPQGTSLTPMVLHPYASPAAPQASSTLRVQPAYATLPTQLRGNMPSRGINYVDWRGEYAGSATQQGRYSYQLPQSLSEAVSSDAKLRPNFVWQGFPSEDAIRAQIQRLLPSYKQAVFYFNPSLSDEQATRIASALLYYSMLYGVDPRFVVAVIAIESSFRPDAVGRKGEIGLGQLMPSTAASLGISNPFAPEQNIEGCVRLLSRYLASYAHLPPERQIALALACYNAGPNAVAKYGGVPPYPITQRYIKKVTELYRQLCGTR